MQVANLTLHRINGSAQAFLLSNGYDAEAAPHGLIISPRQSAEAVQQAADRAVARAVERGAEGLLLGGGIEGNLAVYRAAQARGLPCFALLVKRRQDPDGTYRYELTAVRQVDGTTSTAPQDAAVPA